MMLESKHFEARIKEIHNYGTSRKPQLTVRISASLFFGETADELHGALTDSGLISRDTIPFEVVSNFRGSSDGGPFYRARVLYDGEEREYIVAARDTGGVLRTRIRYEPIVSPKELRLVHPAEFRRYNIKVLEWELHNYRHYFMLFVSSKRFESFDIFVKPTAEGTSVEVELAESELKEFRLPCDWYVERLPFKGLKEHMQRLLNARRAGSEQKKMP